MKGFSLVELIVVIAIIGLLAALAVPAYNGYTNKAKSTQIIQLMTKLQEESRIYYQRHGTWPDGPTDLGYTVSSGFITAFHDYTPYITDVWVGANLADHGGGCDITIGEVEIGLNLDGSDSSVYMDYADINGTIVSTCSNDTVNDPDRADYSLIQSCINPLYPDFAALRDAVCN